MRDIKPKIKRRMNSHHLHRSDANTLLPKLTGSKVAITSSTVPTLHPQESLPNVEAAKNSSDMLGKRRQYRSPRIGPKEKAVLLVLLVIAAATTGLAVMIFAPRADINLKLRTAPLLVDEELDLTADSAENTTAVAGGSFYREIEVSGSAPVSSTEAIGTKATGAVSLINRTFDEQKIKVRSRLVSSTGTLFFMLSDATIPAAAGGSVASTTVQIEAAEAGADGNIAKQRLNFAALDASSQNLVYAETIGDIAGGAGEVVKVIKQDDIESARVKAAQIAQESVQEDITSELPEGWSILDESFEVELLSFVPSGKEGERQDEISFTSRATVRVMGYETAALENRLRSLLEERTASEYMLFPGPISFAKQVKSVDWEAGTARLAVRVTHTTIPKFSADSLREKLVGQSLPQAQTYLEGLPGVQTVAINTSPFWSKKMPRISGRITVDLQPERQP